MRLHRQTFRSASAGRSVVDQWWADMNDNDQKNPRSAAEIESAEEHATLRARQGDIRHLHSSQNVSSQIQQQIGKEWNTKAIEETYQQKVYEGQINYATIIDIIDSAKDSSHKKLDLFNVGIPAMMLFERVLKDGYRTIHKPLLLVTCLNIITKYVGVVITTLLLEITEMQGKKDDLKQLEVFIWVKYGNHLREFSTIPIVFKDVVRNDSLVEHIINYFEADLLYYLLADKVLLSDFAYLDWILEVLQHGPNTINKLQELKKKALKQTLEQDLDKMDDEREFREQIGISGMEQDLDEILNDQHLVERLRTRETIISLEHLETLDANLKELTAQRKAALGVNTDINDYDKMWETIRRKMQEEMKIHESQRGV